MSAKGRLGASDPLDDYPTPAATALAVFSVLPPGRTLLDPCCGSGAILKAATSVGFERRDLGGIEIQARHVADARAAGFDDVMHGDALSNPWPEVDLVVTNPPFSHSDAFVEKAWESVRRVRGSVAMLLRLAWLAPAKRAPLLLMTGMPDVHIVPRPSFCRSYRCRSCEHRWTTAPNAFRDHTCPSCVSPDIKSNTTDAADYAWMIFGPFARGTISRLPVEKVAA